MAFGVWLLSFNTVGQVSVLNFMTGYCSVVCILLICHQLVDIQFVSTFFNNAAINIHAQSFV